MLGAALALLAAAPPAVAAPEPHYYWSCKAEIAREGSVLKGELLTDGPDDYSDRVSMEWQADSQFRFYDWSPRGTLRQRGNWSDRKFDQGTLWLTLETEKKLPRGGWIDFGGERNSGTFLTMFGRNPRPYPGASSRVSLWALLKWAGQDEALTWSALSESPSRMVAGGTLPMAPYHQLKADHAQMLADLDAMRTVYQEKCVRGEYPPDYDNAIMI